MPLVAHNDLPTFAKLKQEGMQVLTPGLANQQDIRELHIGLLNMMPDAALAATERQFLRLIGESNPIAQFFVHPFTLDALPRDDSARDHIARYYDSFEQIKQQGLDALIITGANVIGADLSGEVFWEELIRVADWAHENVTSTLCSCLATHAVLDFRYGQKREKQRRKKWGVYRHQVVNVSHPLVDDINSEFDVPHSRWNTVYPQQFEASGLKILVTGDDGCVHLSTSPDGFRTVFFQGHPEYDTVSLLKEYKRDVNLYIRGAISHYPPMPDNYFSDFNAAILREYQMRVDQCLARQSAIPEFPEHLVVNNLKNTWQDTASAVIGTWLGLIYQVTNVDRSKPFMDGVDANNPLGL
ncbi:MAG: homoserine O-succinyltransferase [Gammaproteobacteria bacterium]|nr:homoserine O-succinyltransferase [Gammaproteobacteria bacterium]MDH3859073.1 homoserine O-succinyltransferase [Gammaproteobacteria bacterium]